MKTSRLEALRKINAPLGLPEIEAGQYLMDTLFKIGPAEVHPMGAEVGLSWVTLDAYARATGALTEPWEMQALFDLSAAYVAAKRDGESIFCIPPVEQVTDD